MNQRFFGLDAVVDARLRGVVLLIDVVLVAERHRALRHVTAVGVEAVVREGDVLVARGVAHADATQVDFLRRTPL